jgi:hypothetical protein
VQHVMGKRQPVGLTRWKVCKQHVAYKYVGRGRAEGTSTRG